MPFKPQTDSNTNAGALDSRTSDAKSGNDSKTIDDKSVAFRKRTEVIGKRENRASLDVTNRASLDVTNRASLDVTNRASYDGSHLPKDMSVIQEPGVESRPPSKPQSGPGKLHSPFHFPAVSLLLSLFRAYLQGCNRDNTGHTHSSVGDIRSPEDEQGDVCRQQYQ